MDIVFRWRQHKLVYKFFFHSLVVDSLHLYGLNYRMILLSMIPHLRFRYTASSVTDRPPDIANEEDTFGGPATHHSAPLSIEVFVLRI